MPPGDHLRVHMEGYDTLFLTPDAPIQSQSSVQFGAVGDDSVPPHPQVEIYQGCHIQMQIPSGVWGVGGGERRGRQAHAPPMETETRDMAAAGEATLKGTS